MFGYHFTWRVLRNGRAIPPVGEWLEHGGPIIACESGLHMSVHPFDALTYAPGNLLHRVELEGEIISHGIPIDKYVGRRRRIIASVDAERMLRRFACQCALDVIHLWEAPPVVREYLETGDEMKRDAAMNAAMNAASVAARAAVWAAARAAAWAAAWDAANDAARGAARAAARGAARDAARGTARDAQRVRFQHMVDEIFNARKPE